MKMFKFTLTVCVDNIQVGFVASNVTITSWTKHVDIRYNSVNEYVEDGIVKIVFLTSAENDNDILTKNLSGEFNTNTKRK